MRVRTYGFPGCLTRPPGTSTRHHPHEPTTSKPVVPEDVLPTQCSPRRILFATAALLSTSSTFDRPEREGPIVTAIYLIAAALVVCGCLFFIMRVRSRD